MTNEQFKELVNDLKESDAFYVITLKDGTNQMHRFFKDMTREDYDIEVVNAMIGSCEEYLSGESDFGRIILMLADYYKDSVKGIMTKIALLNDMDKFKN